MEFGAEFIHGERAATWELVERYSLTTLPWRKNEESMVRLADGAWLTMGEARERPDFDLTRSWALPDIPAQPFEDLQSYLVRIGFSDEQLRYTARSFANACGESMRFLSAEALLELLNGMDGEEVAGHDYRILDGYGALVAALARDLDIRCNHAVTALDWSGSGVRIETAQGEMYHADAAVLTVPLGVLHAGAIRFAPALGARKQQALSGLRMGPVIKLIYRFREAILDPSITAIYSALNPPMWWSPSHGQETDAVVWTAFASGSWAMELLGRGEQAALEAGLTSLRRELARPELDALDARLIDWPSDPYARGGYSFVLPGHHGARALLAEPTPPLYWAGEATEPESRAATVHGAFVSGRRAAKEILTGLGSGG